MIAGLRGLSSANSVRRNHALEHATISIITQRHPDVFLNGRSNRKGFYIFGEVDTEELRSAAGEGQSRLRQGEAQLAIHPRCGTNLAVAGVLSGISAALASQLTPKQNRFGYSIMASLAALVVAPRLGSSAQLLTTSAELGNLRVEKVERRRFLRAPFHFVTTRSED